MKLVLIGSFAFAVRKQVVEEVEMVLAEVPATYLGEWALVQEFSARGCVGWVEGQGEGVRDVGGGEREKGEKFRKRDFDGKGGL